MLFLLAFAGPLTAPSFHDCTMHRRDGTHVHAQPAADDLGWLTGQPGLVGVSGGGGGGTLPPTVMTGLKQVCVVQGTQPIYLGMDQPEGWYAADSHTHWETCGPLPSGFSLFWDSAKMAQTYMSAQDITISTPLLWDTRQDTIEGKSFDDMPGAANVVWGSFPFDSATCTDPGTPEEDPDEYPIGYAAPVGAAGWVDHRLKLDDGTCVVMDAAYEPYSTPERKRYMRSGVEISGFDASELGHVTALNIDASHATLYTGSGCPGSNDGTGDYALPLLQTFHTDPDAITGYAHQMWPVDLCADHLSQEFGLDWADELGAQYSPDFKVLNCTRVAFPNQFAGPIDSSIEPSIIFYVQGMPFLGPMDAISGWVDYIESVYLARVATAVIDQGTSCAMPNAYDVPESRWFGMYYKLLTTGLRIGLTAGTDGTCTGGECASKTYANMGTLPSEKNAVYTAFVEAVKGGRTTLAIENYHMLDASIERSGASLGIGSTARFRVPPTPGEATLEIRYRLAAELFDGIDPDFVTEFTSADRTLEVVVDGEVAAIVDCDPPGTAACPLEVEPGEPDGWREIRASIDLADLGIDRSSWIAVRTQSQSAHTAALYVVIGKRPIADALSAEYFMLYCDYAKHQIDERVACLGGQPGFYGCSQVEIIEHIEASREIFESYRDYAYELDCPNLAPARHGVKSSPDVNNPMAATMTFSNEPGEPKMRISCINAPPDAVGYLLLGKSSGANLFTNQQTAGCPLVAPAPRFINANLDLIEVSSDHAGHFAAYSDDPMFDTTAQGDLDAAIAIGDTVYAQFVWWNDGGSCASPTSSSYTSGIALEYEFPPFDPCGFSNPFPSKAGDVHSTVAR